jgi:putative two-component system response regulator
MMDIREARMSTAVTDTDENSASDVPRLLIAVQSVAIRKVLKHMIVSLGWNPVECSEIKRVAEAASGIPTPHAILLDFSGSLAAATCREIKQNDRTQLIPIVAVTCDDGADQKLCALEAGADDFISQPIHRAELTVRLRSLLRIHKFNQELIGAESVAMALARAVAAKDGYAHRHVEEVANYSVMLGSVLGFDVADLKMLRYGAILHNVGKIAIPDAVLEKTDGLTPREMAMFQQHPRVGCDICAPLKPLRPVLPIIRHHKERWDGTGYPDGLRGSEIPLAAQIVGIVNVFVAMTSNRPYRRALSQTDAVQRLRVHAQEGAHDPDLVERFVQSLKLPIESAALLTSLANASGDSDVLTGQPSVENML